MRKLIGLTFLACLWSLCGTSNLAAQDLSITNARIIVGTGVVINQGSIVVRSGRIVSVSPGTANAAGMRTIDAKGMTAMPGFIDAHRHILAGNSDNWLKDESVARMQEFLDAGYTIFVIKGHSRAGNTRAEAAHRFG